MKTTTTYNSFTTDYDKLIEAHDKMIADFKEKYPQAFEFTPVVVKCYTQLRRVGDKYDTNKVRPFNTDLYSLAAAKNMIPNNIYEIDYEKTEKLNGWESGEKTVFEKKSKNI